MKKRVALLYGGKSEEHDVSVMGYEYVLRLIEDCGYQAIPVYIDKEGRWFCDGSCVFPSPIEGGILTSESGQKIKVDATIPLLHGEGGESGEIQGLLKSASIPFVGADVTTSSVCLDKHYTKCIAKNLGIPVVEWVVFPQNTKTDEALSMCESVLDFPVFLKPRRLGSSIGAYAVKNAAEFCEYFPKSSAIGKGLVMAEKLVEDKRELECAYYSANERTLVSPPGEILNTGFYGYEEKYVNFANTSTEADVNDRIKSQINEYSLALADACGLRHLGRIDYFLAGNKLFFNEINTFPGFTAHSLYPKMIQKLGISPGEALRSFIEDAIGC